MFRARHIIGGIISLVFLFGTKPAMTQCNSCSYRGVSIVTNGNFTLGNTGFSSQYLYNSNLVPEGNYYIGTNPASYHGSFSGKDHTTGTGKFMIINGAPTPGKKVWCQTVTVLPNTYYDFSTWVCSVHPSSPALLQFEINGVQCGNIFQAPSTTFTWQEFYYTWYSGSSTSASICVENMSTISAGNDFGLDDISFSPCLSYNVTNKANAGLDKSACTNINTSIGGNTVVSNINYQWSPSTFLSSSSIATPIVNYTNNSDTVVVLKFVLTLDSLNLGCISRDTISVTIYPAIKPNLGADIRVCDTLVSLSTSITNDSLMWNNGATSSGITVNQDGDFIVTAYRWGCYGKDTVNLKIDTIPYFSIPPSIQMCAGQDTLLTSPFSGLWNTGVTSNSIVVNTSGVYYQTVTNGTCTYRDTSVITVLNYPVVNLGADQLICSGQSTIISSGLSGVWQDNSVGTSFPVSASGTYWQSVANGSCMASDTVQVVIKNMLPITLPDTIVSCVNDPVQLSFPFNNQPSFSWSTGETTPSITVSAPGKYWIQIMDSSCVASDTTLVLMDDLPVLDLPVAQKICAGETATIGISGVPNYRYNWSNGDTTSFINTGTPANYVLTITNGFCAVKDSTFLSVLAVPTAILPASTTICENDSLTLMASGLPGYTYTWNNGSTDGQMVIKTAGLYWLIVTNDICSDTAYSTLFTDTLPISLLPDSVIFCENSSALLTANQTSGINVSWSTGATSNSIPINAPGIYYATLTNGTCSSSDSLIALTDSIPPINLADTRKICAGQQVDMTVAAIPGYQYLWNNGNTTPSISTDTAGTFVLTITNGTCSAKDSTSVFVVAVPDAVLPLNPRICETDSLILTGSFLPGHTNLWSTGSTTASVVVKTAGTYWLVVTNDICSDTALTTVTVDSLPVSALVDSLNFCSDVSAVLVATTQPTVSALWSNGATTKSLQVNSSGVYTVTLTIGVCAVQDTAIVRVDELPVLEIAPTVKICEGKTTWIGILPVPGHQYSWNNGITSSAIQVSTAGAYILTEINGSCSVSDTTLLTLITAPDAILPDTGIICENDSLVLTGSNIPGYNNLWSTGSTASSLTVKTSGTYRLIVTNDICSDTATTLIKVDNLPQSLLSDSVFFCENGFANLNSTSTPATEIIWSTGDTSSQINVSAAGKYYVTIKKGQCTLTDSTEAFVDSIPNFDLPDSIKICEGTDTAISIQTRPNEIISWSTGSALNDVRLSESGAYSVTVINTSCIKTKQLQLIVVALPVIDLPSILTVCENDSVLLKTTPNLPYTYQWNTGSNESFIYVSDSGQYTLTAINGFCAGTDSTRIIQNSLPVSILPDTIQICANEQATLTATFIAVPSIVWSTGATTNTIQVNQPGWYKLTLTNGSCQVKDSLLLITDQIPITDLPASIKICAGSDTLIGLTGGNNDSYTWNTGESDRSIRVNQAGEYIVTVVNGKCSIDDTLKLITVSVPEISLPETLTICENQTYVLNGSGIPGYTNMWSTGANTSSITITSAGIYSVTVTNDICSTVGSTRVYTDSLPVSVLPSTKAFCADTSTTLKASNFSNHQIVWNTGDTLPLITVRTPGIYSVRIKNGACSTDDSVLVLMDSIPSITLPPQAKICQGDSIRLMASLRPEFNYLWSTGATSADLTINQAGTYRITAQNGTCSTSDSTKIVVVEVPAPILPEVNRICITDSLWLTGIDQPGYINNWSTGQQTVGVWIKTAGNYELIVTHDICSGKAATVLDVDTLPISVLSKNLIFCEDSYGTLTATSSPGIEVLWNTGETANQINVSQSGLYAVNLVNGTCSISDSARVTVDSLPEFTLPDSVRFCTGQDSLITVSGKPQWKYLWSNGDSTSFIRINQNRTYSLTVKNGTCSVQRKLSGIALSYPDPVLPVSVTICSTDSTLLDPESSENYRYVWSTGETGKSVWAKKAGTYSVSVFNQHCSTSATTLIKKDSLPISLLIDSLKFCETNPLKLKATNTGQHKITWSTGDTTPQITPKIMGIYRVTIQNGKCKTFDSAYVQIDSLPVLSLPENIKACAGDSLLLNGKAIHAQRYQWNTGQTTPDIWVKSSGNYSLTATNGLCLTKDTTAFRLIEIPSVSIPDSITICENDTIQITAISNPNYQYQWSNGTTGQSIRISSPAIYSITVTNDICSKRKSLVLLNDQLPVGLLPDSLRFCEDSLFVVRATNSPLSQLSWSDGDTGLTKEIQTPGWLKVTLINGSCLIDDSTWITLDKVPVVILPDSIIVCTGTDSSISYFPKNEETIQWSNGSSNPVQPVINTGPLSITVTNGTCLAQDQSNVLIIDYPEPTLPAVQRICETDSSELKADLRPEYSYRWNTGHSSSSIWVKESGFYWVNIANRMCAIVDSTRIFVDTLPVFTRPESFSFCEGDSIHVLLGDENGYAYSWENTTNNTTIISSAGTYTYSVSNGSCTIYDKIIAAMDGRPRLNLSDTSICQGDSLLILLATEPNVQYRWTDHYTGTSRFVKNEGNYMLTAINGSCVVNDSLHLTVHQLPEIIVPPSQIGCMGDTLTFLAQGNPDYQYEWISHQNIISTDTIIRISFNESGDLTQQYTLRVISLQGCSASGLTSASFYTRPVIELGPDIRECADSVKITPIGSFSSGRWVDGSTQVNRWIKKSGNYELVASNAHCTASDQINVILLKRPTVTLPADTMLCAGQTLTLSISEPGTWNNGKLSNVYAVTSPGKYSVTVDNGTCKSYDEINVKYMDPPYYELQDVTICEGKYYVLPEIPAEYKQEWPSQAPNNGTIDKSGWYTLNLSNQCGTHTTQFTVTIEDCRRTLFFPSAFSPNQDGINDVFSIVSTGYEDIDLMIFDRWGEMIYHEKSKTPSWDGTYLGLIVKPDLYEIRVVAHYRLNPNGALLFEVHVGRVTVLK